MERALAVLRGDHYRDDVTHFRAVRFGCAACGKDHTAAFPNLITTRNIQAAIAFTREMHCPHCGADYRSFSDPFD